MTRNDNDKSLEILDGIYNDAALLEADKGKSTPEERKWAKGVRSNVQGRLAEMRRNLMPAGAVKKAQPIRASLITMGRDALLERLAELTSKLGDGVQYAHRHLDELSDDDLRRLIETLDPAPDAAE